MKQPREIQEDEAQEPATLFVPPAHGGAYDEKGNLLHRTQPAGPRGPGG